MEDLENESQNSMNEETQDGRETLYFKPRDENQHPIKKGSKIEPGGTYRTRGGEKARVYAIEGKEMHGAIHHHGVWEIDTWNLDGGYMAGKGKKHDRDILVSPPLSIKAGSSYKARDGRIVQVFAVNKGSIDFPVIGAIRSDEGFWLPRVWNNVGVSKIPYGPNNDLISEWKES